MSEIPTVKGNQLSVGQRVAWSVYAKDDSGKYIRDDLGKKIREYFRVGVVLDTDVLDNDNDNECVKLSFLKREEFNKKLDDDFEEDFSTTYCPINVKESFILLKSNADKNSYTDIESLKVDLFDENEYLENYTNQINTTIKSINKQHKNLENNQEQVNGDIFKVAKILAKVKTEIVKLNGMKAGKKIFITLKEQTVTKLGNEKSTRTLNKAIRVASDKRISENQDRLPNTYSVLYSLTSLTKEEFEKLLEDEEVTPDITRNKLLDKVNEIKGKRHSIKKTFTVVRRDTNAATDNDIERLKEFLESTEWKLKETEPRETAKAIQTPKIQQKKVTR